MNNGDSTATQRESLEQQIESSNSAGGEGEVQNIEDEGLRFVMEGRADHSHEFRKFVVEYGSVLHNSGVPKRYWNSLFNKLYEEIFDAGQVFLLTPSESDEHFNFKLVVSREEGISTQDPAGIFLIDHCCTWRSADELKYTLQVMTGLDDRLCSMLDIDINDDDKHRKILRRAWMLNDVYSFMQDGNYIDLYYLNDEVGSRIYHSVDPNFKMCVFAYPPLGGSFSLLWPRRSVRFNEQVTRDFFDYEKHFGRKLTISKGVVPNLPKETCSIVSPPKELVWFEHFFQAVNETVPPDSDVEFRSGPQRIYTDIRSLLYANLGEKYTMVDYEDDADIIWTAEHVKDFSTLKSFQLLSQFPNEWLLTSKVGLMEVAKRCRRENEQHPKWFPPTYDLKTEVSYFMAHYEENESLGRPNYWIMKAWNLAHGTSTMIVDNVAQIFTLRKGSIPFVISRYVERPILVRCDGAQYKFDFRYHVIVRSFRPLEAFAMKCFWPKIAAEAYDLNKIDELERHLTNIAVSGKQIQPDYHNFIKLFESHNPFEWKRDVEVPTLAAIKEVLKAAADKNLPEGIGQLSRSRALYGVDVMLENTDENKIQPKLLEFNFNCDCSRVSSIHKDFYRQILDLAYANNLPDEDYYIPIM